MKFGYHETITTFYISVVADAINRSTSELTFEEFISKNLFLFDKNIISKYYSKDRLYCDEARYRWEYEKLNLFGEGKCMHKER